MMNTDITTEIIVSAAEENLDRDLSAHRHFIQGVIRRYMDDMGE